MDDDSDGDGSEACSSGGCQCTCHEALLQEMDELDEMSILEVPGAQLDTELFTKAGIYIRKGVFPFLRLPGEVRTKIYNLALRQEGTSRTSPYHRGTIDTAIVTTCRQINKEACHLPLAINRLWYSSSVYALFFVTVLLQPTQRHLIRNFHVDIRGFAEVHSVPLQLLIGELAKLHITEFGATVMGPFSKDWFFAHSCFSTKFERLKHLESFNLVIGSAFIKEKDKEAIVDKVRSQLINRKCGIEGPNTSPALNTRSKSFKRDAEAFGDSANTEKPIKHPRTTRVVTTSKSKKKAKVNDLHPAQRAIKPSDGEAKKLLVEKLCRKYAQLELYAHTFDFGTSAVGLRLPKALAAAKEGCEGEFQHLFDSIMRTLDEKLGATISARDKLTLPPNSE
ncbi:hypothetical protein MMC13_001243 [Lambiella insularis]|nr:hypothetical protein [Lambiella insularis]